MPDSISNLKSIFGQALDIASPAERLGISIRLAYTMRPYAPKSRT